ncbi:hypothetical protein ACEWX3_27665 [Mycobacterium sp. G7A2]|uniref:hypothetical protein n=1 Tax=Mycobacterium sp. G7A2 TaxID=3317307 RepID=UPI0035A88D98
MANPRTATAPTAAPPSSSIVAPDIASADDDGPAEIITEDPTCDAWTPISQKLFDEQQKGWADIDPSIPQEEWSPEQREIVEKAARDMVAAAEQTTVLAARTPHRVMREIYEQAVAYWRAYAAALPDYKPTDDYLASAGNGLSATLNAICAAIGYESAPARSQLLPPSIPPTEVAPVGNPFDPTQFIVKRLPACDQWDELVASYGEATEAWRQIFDPNLPASQWTPSQQASSANMVTVMRENASSMEQIALLSTNLTWRDFAALAANYRRAYVQAIPTYMPSDNFLDSASTALMVAIDSACEALGS